MKTTLNIEGMTCQGCATGLQKALSQVDGVRKVEVSLPNRQAQIEHDPAKAQTAVLIAAVEAAGFDVAN